MVADPSSGREDQQGRNTRLRHDNQLLVLQTVGSPFRSSQLVKQTRQLEVGDELHLDLTKGALMLVGIP
jgi:hypothetical protein